MESTTNLNRVIKCVQIVVTEQNFDKDTNLLEIGIDSITFIRLVVLLEEEFDIELEDSDITLSNFETILNINMLIEKYL